MYNNDEQIGKFFFSGLLNGMSPEFVADMAKMGLYHKPENKPTNIPLKDLEPDLLSQMRDKGAAAGKSNYESNRSFGDK